MQKGPFAVRRKHGQTVETDAENLRLRGSEGPGQPGLLAGVLDVVESSGSASHFLALLL